VRHSVRSPVDAMFVTVSSSLVRISSDNGATLPVSSMTLTQRLNTISAAPCAQASLLTGDLAADCMTHKVSAEADTSKESLQKTA